MKDGINPDILLDYLPCEGAASAVTTRYLANLLDVHPRAITKAVQLLRLDGWPVLSSVEGYFLASGPDDLPAMRRCVRSLRHRIREQTLTLEAMEKAMGELE